MPDEPSVAPLPADQPDGLPVPMVLPLAGLVLVSTPIGNLGDITIRARAALAAADLVLCEDTRHTARLLAALGVSARTQALHEHNEDAAIPGLLARLAQGQRIALVSDAGTPLLSDPGFRLTRAAIATSFMVGRERSIGLLDKFTDSRARPPTRCRRAGLVTASVSRW